MTVKLVFNIKAAALSCPGVGDRPEPGCPAERGPHPRSHAGAAREARGCAIPLSGVLQARRAGARGRGPGRGAGGCMPDELAVAILQNVVTDDLVAAVNDR